MARIEFKLNGEDVSLDAPEEMPLLWAVRDVIGLTGTKYGCGIGLCGACTVHVDGSPARSCVTAVGSVASHEVTTIEGLTGADDLLDAWVELNVAQCGYCQAGQLMTAAALLVDNRNPSPDDIAATMRGVLCRCGTYLRIGQAIELAAERLQ
jgi:isoquinoline 1-oxidoreductase alpha subunit